MYWNNNISFLVLLVHLEMPGSHTVIQQIDDAKNELLGQLSALPKSDKALMCQVNNLTTCDVVDADDD